MSKRRYTLYLSRPLARKLDDTAREMNGAKSALVEEALRVSLSPQQVPGIDDVLARRLDELSTLIKTIERDVAVATETLSLFIRYFLTITPPLPTDDQESARLLGKERFQVFVARGWPATRRKPAVGLRSARNRHRAASGSFGVGRHRCAPQANPGSNVEATRPTQPTPARGARQL